MLDAEGYVEFLIEVDLDDLIDHDIEWLNDYASEQFIKDDSGCLEDIGYSVAPPGSTLKGGVLIKVKASLNSWLVNQSFDTQVDALFLQKVKEILAHQAA